MWLDVDKLFEQLSCLDIFSEEKPLMDLHPIKREKPKQFSLPEGTAELQILSLLFLSL